MHNSSGFHLSKFICLYIGHIHFPWILFQPMLLDGSFDLTCTPIAGLFYALKMKFWLSYCLLSNVISVGRGGEDKGRASAKTHWHPKWGGTNGGVLEEEGRWVCHGCACFVMHAVNSILDYTLHKMQMSCKQWRRSHEQKVLKSTSFKVSMHTVLYPKPKARDIAEPLLTLMRCKPW